MSLLSFLQLFSSANEWTWMYWSDWYSGFEFRTGIAFFKWCLFFTIPVRVQFTVLQKITYKVTTYNNNQQDALFTFNLFQLLTSTCFEQTYCSSSGGITLYVQQLVYVMRYVDWQLAGSECNGQQNIIKCYNTQNVTCAPSEYFKRHA